MDEKALFNKDTMYWREVNLMSPNMIAEIELNESLKIDGDYFDKIDCTLLPFESEDMLYELEDGSAFKKNEVKAWPYVSLNDLAFYQDESNSEDARKAKVSSVVHASIKSITLKDTKGNVILTKTKI